MMMDLILESLLSWWCQHSWLSLTSDSPWPRRFFICVNVSVMEARRQPCAQDDPRLVGCFPCNKNHDLKSRTNQYATWQACVKCGLRMSYQVKGSGNGEHRHMRRWWMGNWWTWRAFSYSRACPIPWQSIWAFGGIAAEWAWIRPTRDPTATPCRKVKPTCWWRRPRST